MAQEFRPLARRERGAYPPGSVRSEQQSQRAKGPARAGTFIRSECLRPRTGRPAQGANRWSSLIPTNSRDSRNFAHFPTLSHNFPQFLKPPGEEKRRARALPKRTGVPRIRQTPHPGPLPFPDRMGAGGRGEGEFSIALGGSADAWKLPRLPTSLPLPFGRGEGRGEGSARHSVSCFTDRFPGLGFLRLLARADAGYTAAARVLEFQNVMQTGQVCGTGILPVGAWAGCPSHGLRPCLG